MIGIGDIITVNGVVIDVEGDTVVFRTKSGEIKVINSADVNTIHPNHKWDGIDHRKGN